VVKEPDEKNENIRAAGTTIGGTTHCGILV
jgi:hypothetical protein